MAFSMAMLFIFDAFNGAEDAAGQQYEVLIMGLAFGAVTLMELTKIPLATAFYYGALWQWRPAFFLALFFVNFSTFETMIQGFEMAYATRSNEVDVQRKVVLDIENQINKLDTDLSLEEINAKILPIKDSINEIESEILQIDRDLGNQTREYASIRSAAETVALNAYNASMGAISESEAQSGKIFRVGLVIPKN